jgi:hypothetical protein
MWKWYQNTKRCGIGKRARAIGPLSYCDPIRTAAEGHKRARAIEGGLQIGALLPVVDDDRPESLHRRNAVVLAAIEVVASL